MSISHDKTATLRAQIGGHPPIVVEPIIFTPDTYMKIDNGGGIAYSLLERDYKDAQCVVINDAESNRNA